MNNKWKLISIKGGPSIKGGWAIFEGDKELYRNIFAMGLQRLCDTHNAAIEKDDTLEKILEAAKRGQNYKQDQVALGRIIEIAEEALPKNASDPKGADSVSRSNENQGKAPLSENAGVGAALSEENKQ